MNLVISFNMFHVCWNLCVHVIYMCRAEFDSKKAGVEKMLCDYVCTVHVEAPKAREN